MRVRVTVRPHFERMHPIVDAKEDKKQKACKYLSAGVGGRERERGLLERFLMNINQMSWPRNRCVAKKD